MDVMELRRRLLEQMAQGDGFNTVTVTMESTVTAITQIASRITNVVGTFDILFAYKDRDYSEDPYDNEVLEMIGYKGTIYGGLRYRNGTHGVISNSGAYDAVVEIGDKYIVLYK